MKRTQHEPGWQRMGLDDTDSLEATGERQEGLKPIKKTWQSKLCTVPHDVQLPIAADPASGASIMTSIHSISNASTHSALFPFESNKTQ